MTSYSVNLSENITESFFKKLEVLAGESLTVRKRLTEITIELLQNIQKHSTSRNSTRLIIQKENSAYSILSENIIHADNVRLLQQKINSINQLDRLSLKQAHTKILGTAAVTKNSGAGLGLYRIAKRSTSTLGASFTAIDQHTVTFKLYVTLTA